MKTLKKIFESTLLIEAKKLMVLDTQDGDKIKKVLKNNGISFNQTGTILSIEIDPKSSQAGVLRNQLNKIAKFDEIKERVVFVHKDNELTEAAASKKGKQAFKDFQKALKKKKIAFARPEFIGNWRYSDINESWGLMAETDSGLEVYILFSYFPGDGEICYSLYDGKNTSESNSIGISHNYVDITPAAFKEMVTDIKEDLDDLDETVNL
jgi:hypothetical protein